MTSAILTLEVSATAWLRHLLLRIRALLGAPSETPPTAADLEGLPARLRADIGLPPQSPPAAAVVPPLCLWRA
jgi:hypothetical protein